MGLFTPIYMKGDLSVRQARAAISKVRRITDPAKLAAIAREGQDHSVRIEAIDRLNDAALLVDMALNDRDVSRWAVRRLEKLRDAKALARLLERHPSLERDYIEHAMDNTVKDQAVLEQLAKNAAHDSVRVRAVERLKNQAVLGDVALHDAVPWVRREAAARLTDSVTLSKIAAEDEDLLVRTAAVNNQNMTDSALLARIALSDADSEIRRAAVSNSHLTDSHTLTQIALNDPDASVRYDVFRYHPALDQEDLKTILRESRESNLRNPAISQLQDAAFLAKIALESEDDLERVYAIRNPRFTDQAGLAEVAIQSDWQNIGEECFKKGIADPALIARIALEAVNAHTRLLAVQRLNAADPALMERIATEDADVHVRVAAVQNGALRDPDALLRIATAEGDAAFLPARWEAALKLSRRDADRAVAPLIAIMKTDGARWDSARFNPTLHFLGKQYSATADPDASAALAAILKRYHLFLES